MRVPSGLAISVTTAADGVHVVQLYGELDMATAPQLTDVLTAPIESGGVADVVIDLGALAFLDAAGLNAFINAHHVARRVARPLRARNAQGEVDTVLRLTGVADLLQVPDIQSTAEDLHPVTRVPR